MQDTQSNNSINITNGISSKMNQKIQNIFEKKSIGTTSMRQRPSQQLGLNQIGGNKSTILQNTNPFLSPDRTQYQQKVKGNEQNSLNSNSVSLSFLVKPGFITQNSQQNFRQTNNSCINIHCTNPINSLNSNHNQNHNHSSINLFESGQIQGHNKQKSIGNSIQSQQKQQSNILNFKNSNLKQPNTPQNGTTGNFFQSNQEKRYSEQLNSDHSAKIIRLQKETHQYEADMKCLQPTQQSFLQALAQKSNITSQQISNRVIQKMRNTNSMSMIRPRQSQDSFFDTAIGSESHSKQARSMLQAKKKKKNKKIRAISPASSVSTAAAAHSQLISQTNRLKSIPSPHLTSCINTNKIESKVTHQIESANGNKRDYSQQNKNEQINKINTQSINKNNVELNQNANTDSFNANKLELQKQQNSSQQNDFIPQFFSKLKKKQMQFFLSNSKDFPQKIETQQDLYNQQQQHIYSCDNSPSYNMWLQQQQAHYQNQQQIILQQSLFSPKQKNINSSITQQQQSNIQQNNSQKNLLESTSFSFQNKQNNNASKTNILLDKLNKLHKQQQNNSNSNILLNNYFADAQNTAKQQLQVKQNIQDHQLYEKQHIDQQADCQHLDQKFNLSQNQQQVQQNINQQENLGIQFINQQQNQQEHQGYEYQQIGYQQPLKINQMQNEENYINKIDILKKFEELLGEQSRSNSHKQSLLIDQLSSDQIQSNDKSSQNNIAENEDSSQQQTKQISQNLPDIPLPSQTLKSKQYQQFENILLELQNSYQQTGDIHIQQFIEYLKLFSQKYIKPIPQIVRNSQQISLQYKKKDEEVNKLKIEKQNLILEKNKLIGQQQIPQFIQIQQQQQELTLKEINTPSTQIEDTNQQAVIAEQQAQIQILQKQLEEKNEQIQKMSNLYLTQFQDKDKSSRQESQSNLSSMADDELCKIEIQNKIENANQELLQRYGQSMNVKSKSSSNLNDNIRQKLKLDLSIIKGNQNNQNISKACQGFGLLLNNNQQLKNTQQAQENQNSGQVLDYYDEFMSKIDEFSLSWRKAVIDESQKYQNRDNPYIKQQYKQQNNQQQQEEEEEIE